jgi:CheY-like chemotaxis protein
VLLDIELPDHDGFWVRERLLEDARTSSIPVLAFTAHAMQGDGERILARGFDGYLAMPADLETMTAAIGRALARGPRR